jgi:FkbM family methyltransferase
MKLSYLRNEFRAGRLAKSEFIAAMHRVHATLFEYADLLPQTDIAAIEITDGRVVLTTRSLGVKFICDRDDHRIAPIEVLNFDAYESLEFDLLCRLIRPGFTVLDIGANIGWYALNIARRFPSVQVHAFEPIPKTYSYLLANIELNRFTNVYAHNFGFSNFEGKLRFYYYPEGSVNASAANLSNRPDVLQVVCPVRTLDSWVNASGLRVDLIKCDVEGAELFVFLGGATTLASQRPVIFTEMLRKWAARFDYHPNQLIDLLSAAGYTCFRITGEGLAEFSQMNEDTAETNFVFLHRERHSAEIASLTHRVV